MDTGLDNNGIENQERTLRPQQPFDAEVIEQTYPLNNNSEVVLSSSSIMENNCPYCGLTIDADADFCESCHRYIKSEVCSYCGAQLTASEPYCPECGNPRGGIVCPICHTMNDFAFCKICGTPLTEEAKFLSEELKSNPDYQELLKSVNELDKLNMCLPYNSDRDIVKEQINEKLRERVFKILSEDIGTEIPVIEKRISKRKPLDVLTTEKNNVISQITELLDKLAIVHAVSPVKARNYAMATKPAGIRLAWKCNYKNAMHSSPCGCAKPHLGGKWIVLGKNVTGHINDDF